MKVYIILILSVFLLFIGCTRFNPPAGKEKIYRLLTTGYCECGKCCGWKRNWYGRAVYSSGKNKGKKKLVGITASGKEAKIGTIAADTTLFPFGTIMYIPGYGYGKVEDRGSSIKGNHIDLFFYSHQEAKRWGRQIKNVSVWK